MPNSIQTDRARALALAPVSRETERTLDALVALALQWQRRINLVGPATVEQFWTRHIANSLQIAGLAPAAHRWVDLGSGGGFPGLVLAALFKHEKPGATIALVERNMKKAAFLRHAAQQLDLPARVLVQDIVDYVHKPDFVPEIVTARAVAPLKMLLEWTAPLIAQGTIGIFPKGQDIEAELTEAAKYWKVDAELVPSVTAPSARIVIVRGAAALAAK